MKKVQIDIHKYANHITAALPKGILLTTKAGEKTNSMVIGWGALGTTWNKPMFIAYVRQSRFTKSLLDANPEFTVNIPLDGTLSPEVFTVCGRQSGRDQDKLAACGLTTVAPSVISVPALKELPLTLECRVTYAQDMDLDCFRDDTRGRSYPDESDFHTIYHGEIVAAYVLEED